MEDLSYTYEEATSEMFIANAQWDFLLRRPEDIEEESEEESEDDLTNYMTEDDDYDPQSGSPRMTLSETHEAPETLPAAALSNLAEKYSLIKPGSYTDVVKTLPNLKIMESNDHIISLQTFLRHTETPQDVFVFHADRLIRLVIEEGLNHLPYVEKTITTPTGESYTGIEFLKSNCGVSIVRSGEAMERALRDCCRAIRIGKILIKSDEDTKRAKVVYCKLPEDISLRKVLLLYPIMGTGNTVTKAIKTLLKAGVKQSNIIVVNLFSTPLAVRAVCGRFPELVIQTTEVHPIVPYHFGERYFGTE